MRPYRSRELAIRFAIGVAIIVGVSLTLRLWWLLPAYIVLWVVGVTYLARRGRIGSDPG